MTLPLKLVTDLRHLSVCSIVDNIERFMVSYYEKWEEVVEEKRPKFGPFERLASVVLLLIIEEFIKREKLTYGYLKVLLPEDAETLTCDENTSFSVFRYNTIELISKRCPDFKVLHFHYEFIRKKLCVQFLNLMLSNSIPRLTLLQEINFCDTMIKNRTIKSISLYCPHLKELNLHRTNFSENDVDSLLDKNSVIKSSLRKLIIDDSYVLTRSVKQCLLNLQNLTHFQSDRTIEAALQLFETVKQSAEASDTIPNFKTTVCKNQFLGNGVERLSEDFLKWLVKKFPEVKHLNISFLEIYSMFISPVIMSWKHITHLELSSWGEGDSISLLLPAVVYCVNLITLKLENFMHVDITLLGNKLKKLEELTLINNTFVISSEIQFENLKEIKVILLADHFEQEYYKLNLTHMHIPYMLLLSILASESIEKVLFYDQSNFTSPLIKDLLERGSLRSLKELKVFKCLIEVDCIWELFNRAIPIRDIVVGFCNISEEDVNQISTYCKKNNLATSITLALEVPYYLRWLVQDGEIPSYRKHYISYPVMSF